MNLSRIIVLANSLKQVLRRRTGGTTVPARLIVLANSLKHGDSCLAGIEISTGKWVRPVTTLGDGRVRQSDMKLGGRVPQMLNILDIPLDATGPDFGFESENRTILPGPWHLQGRASPNDLLRYVKPSHYILHNHRKYVTVEEMKQRPFAERTTLQLVRVGNFTIRDTKSPSKEKHNWKGVISSGGRALELSITDPVLCDKLSKGYKLSTSCLLTMSLSMPYKPPEWKTDEPPACWKLIAGIIELIPAASGTQDSPVRDDRK